MLAPPNRSLFLSVSFPHSPIPSPHETVGDNAKTLHRPQKSRRRRTRCRNHLLRRILRDFGSRRGPEDIRSYEVRIACPFPATLPFHSKRRLVFPFRTLLPLSAYVGAETRGLT